MTNKKSYGRRYESPAIDSFDAESLHDLLGPVENQYQTTTVLLAADPIEIGTVAQAPPPLPNIPIPGVATSGDAPLPLPPPLPSLELVTQGFLSFDISGIPQMAQVVSVDAIMSPTVNGTPLADLGDFVLAEYDWGTLDPTDFDMAGNPIGTATSFPANIDATGPVSFAIAAGMPTFKTTFYFNTPTTSDGNMDVDQATFTPANAVLQITYR